MDDVLTGADSLEEALKLQSQLLQVTMAGGFPLKKWAANHRDLLQNIPAEDQSQPDARAWTSQNCNHSMLGLRWNAVGDHFSFAAKTPSGGPVTKRSILSQTAQLFDPLGWLTPVIIRAKIAIQTTWLLGLDWDDPLPVREENQWRAFVEELPLIAGVQIPRALVRGDDSAQQELHGFADASERAYAAVLYLRTKSKDQCTTSIISAKSKVTPTQQVSLPRLELCAAWLLARLVEHTLSLLPLRQSPLYLWTDSTVTLGWIQGHPSRWKTYVANRVADIQRLVPDARWGHLPGSSNPADCASRGLSPSELLQHDLWWRGPPFLHDDLTPWPGKPTAPPDAELPERRVQAMVGTATEPPDDHELLKRYSSYEKLLRITAWCRRWLPGHPRENVTRRTSGERCLTPLSATEIVDAEKLWIRWVQGETYRKETTSLKRGGAWPTKSLLTSLSPKLDDDGILRVGGRIKHSLLPHDAKHPVILPGHSLLIRLITDSCHRRSLHGGVQLTLSLLRQRFWVPRGRSLVKSCIHRCVTCTRWRAATPHQIMADLPRRRVTPSRPFLYTGVDYAGPVALRTTPGRGHKTTKAFFVIFICLSTKAVHLDVASSYSAEAFLAAFRRLVSRRGMCAELYSDCGTNFVGADAELRRMFTAHSKANNRIAKELAESRVKWRFNPPAAPHFGGLWEAAVKSTKHHLRRVVGTATLTYEEMSTLLTQIEACLNSRPLTALSDDPSDLSALTPGHLLIGSAITALPEPSFEDTLAPRLSRWQHLQQMRDHFWRRWAQEYLQSLLPRPKWQQPSEEYQPGRLCLLRHEATPPARWPLARILRVHPGKDGHVRVVAVKTAATELVRPITKLILLPVANEQIADIP